MKRSVLIMIFSGLCAAKAWARDHEICDQAAIRAAEASGVPASVLMAIARVESGRAKGSGFSPWPWTVNEAGDGNFFADKRSAISHVEQSLAQGNTNIDIGCFQVNIRWHGKAFESLETMFSPDANASYAAGFLQDLREETGSWEGAIGAYHSRAEAAASEYLTKVLHQFERLQESTSAPARPTAYAVPDRKNTFPLLLNGGLTGAMGSLVAMESQPGIAPLLR